MILFHLFSDLFGRSAKMSYFCGIKQILKQKYDTQI